MGGAHCCGCSASVSFLRMACCTGPPCWEAPESERDCKLLAALLLIGYSRCDVTTGADTTESGCPAALVNGAGCDSGSAAGLSAPCKA